MHREAIELAGHVFTKSALDSILTNVIGKTLGSVDSKNVFARTILHPKITGIAGDVIEQSVLGYPPDNDQEPDLIVDGRKTELKTTGIRTPKKDKNHVFEAKEPMTITAVSPKTITSTTFEDSKFWHKLKEMLLVYYHYDSDTTVKASEYANFYIKGYEFHQFSNEEKEILKNDWLQVYNFIKEINENAPNPELEYPKISSELKAQLMLIDTAPKWPHAPRFRLKRAAVSTIVQKYFGEQFEILKQSFSSYDDLDKQLAIYTAKYYNKTISQLITELNIPINLNNKKDVSKSISEQIVTRMFGASSKKMNKIKLFSELGLTVKTITQTKEGARTEDTKLFRIDFDELLNQNTNFEDSAMFNNFNEKQFLFIIFEEPNSKSQLLKNRFIGFKRFTFKDDFIEKEVKRTWHDTKNLIHKNELKEIEVLDKKGMKILNKNGIIRTSINFPKSKTHTIFIRGTGANSAQKPLILNDIKMYNQDLWIKGVILVDLLQRIDYIK